MRASSADAVLVELADAEHQRPVGAVDRRSGRRRARRPPSSRSGPAGSARRSGAPAAGRPAAPTRCRRARSPGRRSRSAGAGVVGSSVDVLDVVALAGRGDVVGDVGRVPCPARSAGPGRAARCRPDHAEQDRRQDEQREPDRRQHPGAAPDVEEEQHGADHRDAHQDVLGRQHRVVVGVGHAGDQRARGADQVEAVEPVVGGLGEHEQAEQHRELHLRGAGQPVARGLQPDAAVEVVRPWPPPAARRRATAIAKLTR